MLEMASSGQKAYSREAKDRLATTIEQDISELGKMVKHLCKSSGTSDALLRCARDFSANDPGLQDTHENLKQMLTMVAHMHEQADSVTRSTQGIMNVMKQIDQTLTGSR